MHVPTISKGTACCTRLAPAAKVAVSTLKGKLDLELLWKDRAWVLLHIPKTGGTFITALMARSNASSQSMESQYLNEGLELVSRDWREPSPWHMPPDVYMHFYSTRGFYQNRTVFCVVREPSERYRSEAAFRSQERHRFPPRLFPQLTDKLGASSALQMLQYGRWIPPSESLTHLQPQSWYVWNEEGLPQCHCVLPIERLAALAGKSEGVFRNALRPLILKNLSLSHVSSYRDPVPPELLSRLYEVDTLLWAASLASTCLCFQPPVLPRSYISRIGRLSNTELAFVKAQLLDCAF
mmetsp:Transcript_58580/g.96706  ORF Transcript_58580/g.96706 Transcript_58580/m.96706 type:complete len:295 (+) Transcript_58580:22-906(+)